MLLQSKQPTSTTYEAAALHVVIRPRRVVPPTPKNRRDPSRRCHPASLRTRRDSQDFRGQGRFTRLGSRPLRSRSLDHADFTPTSSTCTPVVAPSRDARLENDRLTLLLSGLSEVAQWLRPKASPPEGRLHRVPAKDHDVDCTRGAFHHPTGLGFGKLEDRRRRFEASGRAAPSQRLG